MAEGKQGLESLEIWHRTIDLAVDICKSVLPLLPVEEKWALNQQLRRAAQSIPTNIAEGYGRYGFQETIHFCYIARGSMAEVKTQLILAHRLGYIDDKIHEQYQTRLAELGKMLHGYIKFLKNQKVNFQIKETQDEYGPIDDFTF